ncbi:MAG: hypothetical protein AB7O45_05545 [Alphaproteobacteria bacterium]
MQTASARWRERKPQLVAPVVSSIAGWQVTAGTVRALVQAGVIDAKADICAARARGETAEAAKLDWSTRRDLAGRWAMMPGEKATDSEVQSACVRKLER